MSRVIGSAVASLKESRLTGAKLLVVDDVGTDGASLGEAPYVAVDLVGAGEDEVVLVVRGSPASRAVDASGAPTDAAIVGIVDSLRSRGRTTFQKG